MRPQLILFAFTIGLLSCLRESEVPKGGDLTDEITFAGRMGWEAATKSEERADGWSLHMEVLPIEAESSKASAVNSLSSFYVVATTGSAGSENLAWGNTSFSGSGTYSGGRFWPSSNPGYHFYASNQALDFQSGGCSVNANSGTDVVCAYLADPGYGTRNTLTFQHIFARIGRFTVSQASSEYVLHDVDITLTPNTSGQYNLRTQSWSNTASGSPVRIGPTGLGYQDNDLYLVPGSYTVYCSWTLDYRGFSSHYETEQTVYFAAGKIYNLSAELSGSVTIPPLTFYCDEAGTFTIYGNTSYTGTAYQNAVKYSINGGSWVTINTRKASQTTFRVKAGDVIVWEKTDGKCCHFHFTSSNKFHAYGNINSLNNYSDVVTFKEMYHGVFYNCTKMETYQDKRIILPHTTLTESIYNLMFYYCEKMQYPPELPATELADRCYYGMFNECISLIEAPALPAMTLKSYCYWQMFKHCTSLVRAPDLPATTVPSGVEKAYGHMFVDCTSLQYLRCRWDQYYKNNCEYWVSGVPTSGGTFYKRSFADWSTSDAYSTSHAPRGWTVVNE